MAYSAPGASVSQVVKYIGDGTLNRVLALSFTPRQVTIFQALNNAFNSSQWDGDLIQQFALNRQNGITAWQSISKVSQPANFPFVANGFDIGKAHNFDGVSNGAGNNLILIARP